MLYLSFRLTAPKKKAAIAQYGLILRERHIIINVYARLPARFCNTIVPVRERETRRKRSGHMLAEDKYGQIT
jgi:hypothetical protein